MPQQTNKPLTSPLGGIPAPGTTQQPASDVHPDLNVQQQADTQSNPPNESVQVEQQTTTNNEPIQGTQTQEGQTSQTTEQQTQTPAESQKSEDFDFTKFLELEGSSVVSLPEKAVDKGTQQQTQVQQQQQQPPSDARDYTPYETLFGKDNIADFKKIGNDAFRKLEPVLKEHTSVKEALKAKEAEIAKLKEGRVPDSYYENERAFILTPDFQEAATTAQQADMVAQHWENQLAKIRGGETEYQSLAYNERGEIVTTAPIKIDGNAEATIMRALITTQQQAAQAKASLQNLQQTFAARHKELVSNWQTWEAKAFPAFEKPEAKPIVDDTVKRLLPPAFHTNPLARGFAKLFLVNTALVRQQQQGAGQQQQRATTQTANGQQQQVRSDRQAAGPQPNIGTQGAGTVKTGAQGGDNITFDDFENRLQGI